MTHSLAQRREGSAAGVAAGTLDEDLAQDTKRAEKRHGDKGENRRWTDGGQNEIGPKRKERDNDDETLAGQNRAAGWIEVKLIWPRELRGTEESEREKLIEGMDNRWVLPCNSLLTTCSK